MMRSSSKPIDVAFAAPLVVATVIALTASLVRVLSVAVTDAGSMNAGALPAILFMTVLHAPVLLAAMSNGLIAYVIGFADLPNRIEAFLTVVGLFEMIGAQTLIEHMLRAI